MTELSEMRLLPWTGPEGKPCFLSSDDGDGHLSRLADSTETLQLGLGAQLLEHAEELLAAGAAPADAVRRLAHGLASSLREALRVAESRGHRLAASPATRAQDGDEGPKLPAAAFG